MPPGGLSRALIFKQYQSGPRAPQGHRKVTEEQVEGAGPILSWQLLALHPFPPGAAAQRASEGFHLKPFSLCTRETFP